MLTEAVEQRSGRNREATIPRETNKTGDFAPGYLEGEQQLTHTGIRSPFYVSNTCRHRYDMQRIGGLGVAQRADPAVVEEAWTVETGYHEDGTGGHGISG